MEPSFVFLVVNALATWQIVEIWHHSAIMSGWRARTELWDNFFGDLLRCPFCLSLWVAAASVTLVQLPGWLGCCTQTVLLAFAVARLANLGNDVFHGYCRTPKYDSSDIPQDAEDDQKQI